MANKYVANIKVQLKPEVNDPQGNVVFSSLQTLGFDEVQSVRVGKFIQLRLTADSAAAAKERAQAMCDKLLAQAVIEFADIVIADDK